MAKYDGEYLKLTERYKSALHELILAELEMVREHEPDNADCWTWGYCEVGDIARFNGLGFCFGGDEDKPEYMKGTTMVIEL